MYYSSVPKILDLLKIFVTKKKPNLIKNIFSKNNNYKIYSKSSWSILIFCKSIFIEKQRKINLAVPSYYCDYALKLINQNEVNIIYYDIDDDFIDLDKLKSIDHKIDVLISVNYFGKKCTDSKIFDFCKSKNIYLIEDSTHCIIPPSGREYGDIILYSPYKFVGSLSGAILLVNSKGPNRIDSHFFEKGLNKISNDYKKKKIITFDFIVWLLKKLIQNIISVKIKIEDFESEKKISVITKESIYLDYFTEKFFISQIYKIYDIIDTRKKSFLLWQCLLKKFNIKNSELIFKKNFNSYSFIIEDKYEQIIELYNYLKTQRLPVSTWPDLNKKIKIDKDNHANNLRRQRIFLPIHSLNNKNYINLLDKKFNYKLKNSIIKKNNFLINEISKENYYNNLSNVSYTNLLQTVQHFISKKKMNNFLKSKYYEITSLGKVVGIFQLIYFNFFFYKFSLLNRGPLFIKNTNLALKEEIIVNIQDYFKKKKFQTMIFIPELNLENIKNLQNYSLLNFIGSKSWNTKIINLKDNLEDIKKNFSSKIRNVLNHNIKDQNIEIKKIQNFDEFLKLLNLLEMEQKKKNYKGLNKEYIISLFDQNCINTYIAVKDNILLGGIIVSEINDTATYLSGYFNKLFKLDNLSYRLLFLAITESKRKSLDYFDMGGLDYINNYSVAKFKNDFGGKNIQLLGKKIL